MQNRQAHLKPLVMQAMVDVSYPHKRKFRIQQRINIIEYKGVHNSAKSYNENYCAYDQNTICYHTLFFGTLTCRSVNILPLQASGDERKRAVSRIKASKGETLQIVR